LSDSAAERTADDEAEADDTEAKDPPAEKHEGTPRGRELPPRVHLVVGLIAPMIALLINAWRVRWFTIDDAYISYRYARNLARGWGLVFNQGEAIEGYTNFGWTVLLAGGISVGIDPDVLAKVVGAASAAGTLTLCYFLSRRFAPYKLAPCFSTWLLACSMPTIGYAMFGLETSFFVFLVVAGLYAMFLEHERPSAFPWSGIIFGLAGLTRPEAPMFLGIPMLLLGRKFFGRQNLIRGFVFVAIVGAHILWRKNYYGEWLPNTFTAKTGDPVQQYHRGKSYIAGYLGETGPAIYLIFAGAAIAVVRKHREMLTLVALSVAVWGYIMTIGGDWMPHFRFMAPFEPFAFVLVGVGARTLFDTHQRAIQIALAMFALYVGVQRYHSFEDARRHFKDEDQFWESAVNQSAEWLVEHNRPGYVAVADMGYIGYRTDFPVLDLLGLVDPVISRLPGGYTKKTGPGYVKRVFEVMPRYFVLVGGKDCTKLSFAAQRKLRKHPQFKRHYYLAKVIMHSKKGAWCIFERDD
jgi:hypothetical protein